MGRLRRAIPTLGFRGALTRRFAEMVQYPEVGICGWGGFRESIGGFSNPPYAYPLQIAILRPAEIAVRDCGGPGAF